MIGYGDDTTNNSSLAQGLTNYDPVTGVNTDAQPDDAPQVQEPATTVQVQTAPAQQIPTDSTPSDAMIDSVPQPDVPATDLPRFHRTIGNTLRGMLMGLAQGGIPGAVAGGASPQWAQRNADQAEQSKETALATQKAQFQFQSAQAAAMAADAAVKAKLLDNYDADHQRDVFAANQKMADWFINKGYLPTTVTSNDGQSEMAAAKGMGTVPPVASLQVGSNSIMHFDLSQIPQQVGLDAVNQLNSQIGKPSVTSAVWAQTPAQAKLQMIYNASQYWAPAATADNVLQYKNDRARVASIPASQLPDKAATLKQYDTTIGNMQSVLDAQHAKDVQQKAQDTLTQGKADATVAGEKEYAVESAKDRADAAAAVQPTINGQWNPASMPVGLVEGTIDPSQLSKRSKDYNQNLTMANEYSLQKYGKPFDIAQAQADYKYATATRTQDTLKMIQSMIEPNGSIQIAAQAAAALPGRLDQSTVNKAFNATATEFGSVAVTNFHTAMLGLADEYSKVMGGGISSDTGRQQALDILKANYSNGQLAGAIGIMQKDIAARKTNIIGQNRYLLRQYGGGGAASVPGASQPGGQPTAVSSDGKWMWNGSQWIANPSAAPAPQPQPTQPSSSIGSTAKSAAKWVGSHSF